MYVPKENTNFSVSKKNKDSLENHIRKREQLFPVTECHKINEILVKFHLPLNNSCDDMVNCCHSICSSS